MQPPLVGNEAPDFLAQAVFDQEFVEVSLSQYRVSGFCKPVYVQLLTYLLKTCVRTGSVRCSLLLSFGLHVCVPN